MCDEYQALSRGNVEYVEPDDLTNTSEFSQRFSKVFLQRKQSDESFDSIEGIDELEIESDNDNSELEMNEEALQEEERIKQSNLEKLEKQKAKVAKLTQKLSLRPSLAKLNMIKKLRQQRQQEKANSRKNSYKYIEDDNNIGDNFFQENFDAMSLS